MKLPESAASPLCRKFVAKAGAITLIARQPTYQDILQQYDDGAKPSALFARRIQVVIGAEGVVNQDNEPVAYRADLMPRILVAAPDLYLPVMDWLSDLFAGTAEGEEKN